jgi:hypothetical protein
MYEVVVASGLDEGGHDHIEFRRRMLRGTLVVLQVGPGL